MKSRVDLTLALLLSGAALTVGWSGEAAAAGFKMTKLVADLSGKAKVTDPNLVNPWGLSQSAGGPAWVSDNGTGLSTVYNRTSGSINPIVVTIPQGFPTGTVFASSSLGFMVSENSKSGAATFIFDSEAGIISGWSQSVDGSNAITTVDNSATGAVYKGLALDTNTVQLYAANFSQNRVEVYNNKWQLVNSFTDTTLPKKYAPFNVMDVNGTIYVSFAERDRAKHDEIDGPGLGYVDMFNTSGQLQKQLVVQGALNAPWGMAIAPSSFGTFANDLLVGNFGDGKINVYDPSAGTQLGTLSNSKGAPLVIQGLWALDAGPGTNQVNFAAGPKKESHGLFGLIQAN